ncbi:hypothetical protein [Amaricoccus tamworthensis]|uniref:hypothetical protein n=1 Tax=Amaricoccus tamworthensis TaxID=57002 RepID=UPI003C7A51FB
MRAFILLFLIAGVPVHAEELAHCYFGDAPEGAPLSSDDSTTMDGFYSAFDVAAARYACGLLSDTDLRVLDAQLEAGGCSPESEIAAFAASTWEEDASEYRAALEEILGGADATGEFCTSLEVCESNDGEDYPPECYEVFKLMMEQE